jgi:hypothetical protein
MNKQFCVAMLVLIALLSTAGLTMAANHKNMVGTWSGIANFVTWNSEGGFYYTNNVLFTFLIQNEDFTTGNFYGLEADAYPFTGNVATNKRVTIIEYEGAGEYRILTGTVSGKKISGTMQHFKPGQIDTGTFTFYKE